MFDDVKNSPKSSRSQLVGFVRDSYLERTSRPIYALAYLMGFIILYEIGSMIINPDILSQSLNAPPQIQVVAFVWVRNMLEYLGFSQRWTWMVAPLVIVVILVALQITSRTGWKVYVKDFIPMTMECIVLAVPLIVLSMVMSRFNAAGAQTDCTIGATVAYRQVNPTVVADTHAIPLQNDNSTEPGLMANIVTGIGAGIYEELVFRLVLICLLMMVFQDVLGVSKVASIVLSITIAAVLFSAHHHIFIVNGHLKFGEPFTLIKFLFRSLAGVYFAVIFALRGFGITAGTHAFYNIIAAILNAYPAG